MLEHFDIKVYGGMEIQESALDGSGQLHAPTALSPVRNTKYKP
jgi:hypothetical protein